MKWLSETINTEAKIQSNNKWLSETMNRKQTYARYANTEIRCYLKSNLPGLRS